MILTNLQKRALKGLAQRMDPLLKVGKLGLTDSLIRSADEALERHELVKVRFESFKNKEQKQHRMPELADRTKSLLIARVGHVAVFFRRNPDPEKQRILI